jgi:uncharacterized DUF497 family protein
MPDLSQAIGFDRDEGNSSKSTSKHLVSQNEAEQIFFDDHLVLTDDLKHSKIEVRYQALGRTAEGRLLHVTFTLRDKGTLIRVISARDANRKERAAYE